jgi:hypothetical protein
MKATTGKAPAANESTAVGRRALIRLTDTELEMVAAAGGSPGGVVNTRGPHGCN